MKVHEVSDADLCGLYLRSWKPDAPGHWHGQTVWAVWDGRVLRWGLQPGCAEPGAVIKAQAPELAAGLAGVPMPQPGEILLRGMAAFGRWVAAGLPVVGEDEHRARAAACGGCERWDGDARGGLGHCKHPGCGCTRLKWWLKTERCPAGKWPA